MAVAAATINIYPYPRGTDNTQRMHYVRGTFSIATGGTYPPGGFPLNWNNLEQIKAIPLNSSNTAPSTATTILPIQVQVASSQNPPSGYIYLVDGVLGNLHIFETDNGAGGSSASGPLLEIGGAIDNKIVTDVIQFEAVFVRE